MIRIKRLKDYGFKTENRTYVIAEIGINHGGDIDIAKKLIESAARTGVDAVKFQTYLTEKRAPKGNQAIFDILKKCELPLAAFKELKRHAEGQKVAFFSTPFDVESIKCLESIGCEMYKISSFDVVNQQLLKAVASMGKTVVMSVGMSELQEIKAAYKILRQKTNQIAILHCISAYPTQEKDANLSVIYELREAFDCVIGQSDHTPKIVVPLYAVAAGAQVIEKHYKIDDRMQCVDAPVSITEKQTGMMVAEIRRIETMFGNGQMGLRQAEKGAEIFRRISK